MLAETVKRIADEVSCNCTCYVNLDSDDYFNYPNMMNMEFQFYLDSFDEENPDTEAENDEDIFKMDAEKLRSWEHVLVIEPMESREDFRVMENFIIDCVPETDFLRPRLFRILEKSHPFSRFRDEVLNGPYREAWFDYRLKAYVQYVRELLELEGVKITES